MSKVRAYTGTGRPAESSASLLPGMEEAYDEGGGNAPPSTAADQAHPPHSLQSGVVPTSAINTHGYEEFFGGEVTCPSCQGAGKIPRGYFQLVFQF